MDSFTRAVVLICVPLVFVFLFTGGFNPPSGQGADEFVNLSEHGLLILGAVLLFGALFMNGGRS